MKDISEIDKCFDKYVKTLESKLVDAQQHATESMFDEARDRIDIPEEARNIQQFVDYAESLQIKPAEFVSKEEIKSSVFSDLVVADGSKWDGVPIGAFLEWGTGPLGEDTNSFPHGYPYTTEEPWDAHTDLQLKYTGTWGIAARPHMYPALVMTEQLFIQNVKEAQEEAWTT